MTYRVATTIRTAMAQPLSDAMAGGSQKVFTGACPANISDADPAGLIATGALPNPAVTDTNGVLTKAGSWTVTGVGAGNALSFRHYSSASACVGQGTVGYSANQGAWQGSHAYTLGQTALNGSNVYAVATAGTSASSGGPTGTSAGITDGTVTWNYVGPTGDMTLDNINIAVGQAVSVNTFSVTVGA